MGQPLISIKLALYPGLLGEPSLLDVYVTSSSPLNPAYPNPPGTMYDGWCLDPNVNINTVTNYTAYVYSTTELSVLQAGIPSLGNPDGFLGNLDSINWLLNWYDGTNAGITWQEVQSAIWKLMGEDWVSHFPPSPGTVDQLDIDAMYNAALSHDGFVPVLGQKIGVILDPIAANGAHQQPLIIETNVAKLGDYVWHDLNADGIQNDGAGTGIAGVTVNLVRDLNNDSDFNDANEVLATTTTDANGYYAFDGLTPGLNYQVLFTMPTGFDAASPRQSDSNPASGTNSDGLVSNVITLGSGEYNQTIDAGFYKKASQIGRAHV